MTNIMQLFRGTGHLWKHTRNIGWWENVWSNYSDKRFKKTFRVSRQTLSFTLCQIRGDIEKDS